MNASLAPLSRRSARRALTLIELVVVMVILVALAGVLLPKLTGMITRAHTSTSATNIAEIAKAIGTYQAEYLGYPDKLDSLVTSVSAGTPFTPMASGGTDITTVTLTDDTVAALNGAGITQVTMMATSGTTSGPYSWSPTFYPYAAPITGTTTPAVMPLVSGNMLLGITGTAATREFATPATASYVMLGIGRNSTLSRVMQEAPIHFDDDPARTPQLSYSRYAAIFQTTNSSGVALDNAILVGVVGIHDDQVSGLGDHLEEYWNTNIQN